MTSEKSELQLHWQGQLGDLVTAIVCVPNGRGWVASSADGEVVWNAGLDDLVQLQAANGQSIDSLAVSADSRWLVAGGQAGELFIWDCHQHNLQPQFVRQISLGKWIEHLAWHPIEPHLAIGYGAQLQVWDIPNFTQILSCPLAQSSIFDLAWHQSGQYLAMAGYQGVQVKINQLANPPTYWIKIDTASLKLAWSEDGRYLAAGNLDRTLTIIDWQQPTEQWTLAGCPGKIRQLAWISNSPPCLAIASGSTVVLWQLNPITMDWAGSCLEGHQDIVTALIAHPSQPLFVSGSSDGYACLWSAQGELHQIITDGQTQFTTLTWHPEAAYLLTGSQMGTIGLWLIPA